MGRPPKYNAERHKIAVQAIAGGLGRTKAAELADIAYNTFLEWLEKYPEFSNDIKKAEENWLATREQKMLEAISEAAITDGRWQAAAWILERGHGDKYKLKQDVNINHSGEIKLPVIRWADDTDTE